MRELVYEGPCKNTQHFVIMATEKKYRKDLGQADQSFRKITFRKITVTMKWKMYAKEQIRIMRQNSK